MKNMMKSSNSKRCIHSYQIIASSNIVQYDSTGYRLRLFIHKCSKCNRSEHIWLDDNTIDEADSILNWNQCTNESLSDQVKLNSLVL